jgi:hypothetical protein
MLSKSRFTRGSNCHRSLWLYHYKRQQQFIPEATQKIFARGTSAGELARDYFPGGHLAVLEPLPGYASAKRTQQLIARGAETIYEATFIFDDTLVAIDILHKNPQGLWDLYEVKSTNGVKPEHAKDVAVQYYVAQGCGIPMGDAFLMHFNRDYVRLGPIEVRQLFLPESILPEVSALLPGIKTTIAELQAMLKGSEPQIAMGPQCEKPYHCDFFDYCSALLPPVTEAAPALSSEAIIDKEPLKDFLSQLQYPLYFLDFETIMPGVPLFDESRPYQQLPFQYSLHHQYEKDGLLYHDSYLAESRLDLDPRPQLIEQLIERCAPAACILAYHLPFERGRIEEMQRDFPQYADGLQTIIDRMHDLIIPFKRDIYRTETMEGSSSIKKVLPALCPEFSYNELEIGDGMTASNAFLDLYYCNDDATIQQTRQYLLDYCHLDTLAMVKILEVLYKSLG